MKLEQFNELFRRVYFPSLSQVDESGEVDVRRQVVRILDSLAYCEFDFDGRMVYMCKPSFVLLPVFGLPKAVLVGARSPALIQKLKAVVKNRQNKAILKRFYYSNHNEAIPATMCIEAMDIETIEKIAKDIKISFESKLPAAWALANISASLKNIKESLNFENRAEPNWKRRIFSKGRLSFSKFENANQGCFLAEYKDPVSQQLHHWLWKDGATAMVGRDWGRYLFLAEEDVNILLYDKKYQKLAVPLTVPLPCILARAVALCTGAAPLSAMTYSKKIAAIPPEHSVQVYSGITDVIAKLVASKLCQKLNYTHFEIDKGGVLYA
ncbi:MAG: hypothetical protein GF350_07775 [Chitinivibrionales bacterium]|nr:hypothetical protein [Chitinivibrionales bacterium]